MTKIKNYPLDLDINGSDKWIGTDSASLAKLTKNFTPDNLAKYYNDKEVVESVNQMRFFYDTVDPGDDRANGSFSFPTEVGTTVPFSSISDLVFSKYTMGNDAVNNFMTDIVNSIIIIQKADNPDIYAFYALNGYEVDPSNPDFYNVALSFESGNGSVEEDQDYLVSLIQFAGAAGVQTILGSEFIDSTLTGVGEVTLSLSATGTPSNLTGLRGDNTWGTLGLEALDEGGRNSYLSTDAPIGWRLIGRDPSLYGNIGEDAIDFSTGYFQNESLPFGGSITNSPQIGSTGPGSFTLGNTVENNSSGGVVFGSANVLNGGPNIEPTYFVGGVILGQYNQSYGLNYYNFTSGYKNLIGDRTQQSWSDAGFPSSWPIQYWSGQIGMFNQMPSGYASVQLGYGLLSGGPFCTTVGLANEDVTLTIAKNIVNDRNALNPRFIVGCGTFAGNTANPSVGVRQNGFVVMSDGTATFPILTNAMIDAAGADSAVTKGWVQAQTDVNTTYDLASAQNGADVDVTLTGSDATVDTVKLVAGANIVLTDSGTNEITIDAIGAALSAEQVRIEVKNTSGVTLTKGTPVYITGTVGATVRAEVAAADASSSATMPAVGVLAQDLINNADGYAVTGGFLSNVTTDPIDGITPVANQTVYVKPGGGLTLTKPTGSNLIQNIAKVGKISGGSAGSLVISSILRTNDVPNLTEGKIWVGTAANTSESTVVHLDESNGRMGIGTASPAQALDVAGSIATSGVIVGPTPFEIYSEFTNRGRITLSSGTSTGANQIAFLTDGTAKMVINKEGNVGIGTTSPSEKLEVDGTFTVTGNSTIQGRTNIQKDLIIRGTDALANQGATRFYVDNSNRLFIDTANDGANLFTIDSSGNVGIGTTSPSEKLNVAGNQRLDGDEIYITQAGSARKPVRLHQSAYKGAITLQRDGVDNVNISSDFAEQGHTYFNGTNVNVGIGTTSPATKLEVVGGASGYLMRVSGTNTFNVYDAGGSSIGAGSGSGQQLKLFANDSFNNGITIDTNGNVGINESSPAHKVTSKVSADNNYAYYAVNSAGGNRGGIYITSAGDTQFVGRTAAGQTVAINANANSYFNGGNVGIGTTSPAQLLHLASSSPKIRLEDSDGTNQWAQITEGNGALSIVSRNDTTAGVINLQTYDGTTTLNTVTLKAGNQVQFNQYGSGTFTGTATQRLAVDSSGNVIEIPIGSGPVDGSGTANYTARWIDVDTIGIGSLYDDGTGVGIGTTTVYSNSLNLNNAGSLRIGNAEFISKDVNDMSIFQNKIRVTSTGDVGIGTTSPSAKLEVTGDLNLYNPSTTSQITFRDIAGSNYIKSNGYATQLGLRGNTGNGVFILEDVFGTTQDLRIKPTTGGWDLSSRGVAGVNALLTIDTVLNVSAKTNVGIGTTSPTDLLHIEGASTPTLKIVDTTNTTITELYSNDFDTYLANESSGRVFIRTGGSNGFVVDSAGDVGIGTTNPIYKLDIQAESPAIRIQDISDANSFLVGADNSGGYLGMFTNDSLRVYTNSLERIRITDTGNVGIGTTSPAAKLEIGSTENVAAIINSTNTFTFLDLENDGINRVQIGNASDGDFIIRTADTERLRVTSTGNVGIGTSNPTHRLYVQGDNGPLLVTREITTPNQVRIGIGETNPSTALTFGSYSDRIITGAASLRFSNGPRISEFNSTRLVSQANGGFFFYPTTATPSADAYGVDIRHLRDSAVNTTDAVLSINNSVGSNLMLVRSDGRVGIATTNPASKLHVQGDTYIQNGNLLMSAGVYGIANVGNIAQKAGFPSSGNFAFQSVDVGIGTTTPAAKLDVNGGVRVANDAAVASATNVGTLRYRADANNSYVDMCMQTGAATYAWVNIVQNNW